MKKLFLAAFAVFAFASVNAQDITFGAKAGVNFASVTGDDVDADGRTSFHLGAVANIGISEKFSVQPELLYSSQGFTNDGDVVGKLDYISLPILASFEVADGFSVQAGPQVAFNINDSIEVDGDDAGDLDAESVDFALAAGVQYKMESGLFFQARYGFGFSDIISDSDGKNSVIALSVGYFFL